MLCIPNFDYKGTYMLDFRNLMKKAGSRRQRADKAGIQLLASILVCYPEIESVTYEPKDTKLTLDFVIEGKLATRALKDFIKLLDDSLQAYHEIDTASQVWMAAEAESHGNLLLVHIHRQLITMTRGELTLIVSLFRDAFPTQLKMDKHVIDQLEPDFVEAQSAILDQLLDKIQDYRIRERMIGVRDDDRVVVYNR